MTTRYIVTAGYVTATTAVPGGRARVDIPRGAQLPDDVPAEEIDRLLSLGYIKAEEAAAGVAVFQIDPKSDVAQIVLVPTGSVADVLAWVGDDLERATAALTAEQARGDRARSTLLTGLESLLAGGGE